MNHICGDDGHALIEALETMIDGELTAREQSVLEKHLEECADCRWWRDRLVTEQRLYERAGTSMTIEPPAMWAEISLRLKKNAQRRRWGGPWHEWLRAGLVDHWREPIPAAAVALSIALLAGLAMSPSRPVPRPAGVDKSPPTVTLPAPDGIESGPAGAGITPPVRQGSGRRRRPATGELADKARLLRQIRRSELEYQKTVRLLERAIARRPDNLAPEAWKEAQASLARIDEVIVTSRAALLRDPMDATAVRFVISAYAKKVELLQFIALR